LGGATPPQARCSQANRQCRRKVRLGLLSIQEGIANWDFVPRRLTVNCGLSHCNKSCCPRYRRIQQTCWTCGGTGRAYNCHRHYPTITWTLSGSSTFSGHDCNCCPHSCCCCYTTCTACSGTGYIWVDQCDCIPHWKIEDWKIEPVHPIPCHPHNFREGFGVNKVKQAR